MTNARPTLRTARYRAIAQSLKLWFCHMLLWLADFLGDSRFGTMLRAQVREDLRETRRLLRCLVLLIAMAQLPPSSTKPRGPTHPFKAPRGFARTSQHGSDERCVTRVVRFRGRGLRESFALLRDVVDNLDACAALVARRIRTGALQRQPRLVRGFASLCESLAPVPPATASPVFVTGPPG